VNDTFNGLATELDSLGRIVQRIKARHVNTKAAKNRARSCVHLYFENARPLLSKLIGEDVTLTRLDNEMQELLRCTQRRALVADYRSLLKGAKEALSDLELKSLGRRNITPSRTAAEPHHDRILEMLRKICPSAAVSYEQALCDLSDTTRKSWRGTAVEFREALREVLDLLAPTEDVRRQPGFKLEPDADGPTMKQKAVFILKSRRPKDPQIKSFADALDVVEESIGKFVRSVYTRSSLAVHVPHSADEAKKIRNYVSLVLAELLEIKD